jgi:hypothetical protein
MSDFRFSGGCSVLLSAALMVHAHASTSGNADVIGTWLLTKVLDQAEVTAMDDKQAAKLIGRTLVIRPDGIIFSGEPCQRSDVERHKEDAAKYVRENYHAPIGRLGLPATVTVVDLTCTEALLKSKNKMVVFWDGFFFDAVKQQPDK